MFNIKAYLSQLNKRRKNAAPFVTRRRYQEVLTKYNILKNSITSTTNPLTTPPKILWVKPYAAQSRELCIFVTYAQTPRIKPYVAWHVEAFIKQGIDVVLVINTDQHEQPLEKPNDDLRMAGLCIRENKGFDFGAWSHIMATIETSNFDRVYWVNDSLFGPLTLTSFDRMIASVRASTADLVGLTENGSDERHLQSFFLSFNHNILQNNQFATYAQQLWQLPTKSFVIEFYEVRLTRFIEQLGFTTQALFSLQGQAKRELTYSYPRALHAQGFPYLKTALIRQGRDEGLASECLPQYLPID